MSRIGKLPINIPAGVTVTLQDNVVSVKGPKGELSQVVDPSIIVTIENNEITFAIDEKNDTVENKQKQAFHGLYRALVNNMVVGVSQGYKKEMELVGVGYRVSNQGNLIEFALGYTHSIFLQLPKEITVETKSERNKNPYICLESCEDVYKRQVMNPVDHPMGGGEGRQSGGHPRSRTGLYAKGLKTRAPKKQSNKYIIERRKK